MNIIYSKHSKKRMKERGISESDILECLNMPDYTVSVNEFVESYRKINNGVIKVVSIRKDSFIKVISVMWK